MGESFFGCWRSVLFSISIIAVIAILIQFYVNSIKSDTGSYYKAGVVEYSPYVLNSSETPPELILRNADKYVQIINSAALHAVDILVFPECGLTSIAVPTERAKIFPYLTELPEVGAIPCDEFNSAQVLKRLSCAAREAKLYLVINLDEIFKCQPIQPGCPLDQSLFYNTNIAFDRNGKIIAKYRKYNLYIEPEFNITEKPDLSMFETDFGVKFGMFICFDVMFKEPALELLKHGVTDIVYSTAWFSELPYITAVSIQAAWSYSNNINFLSSGYNNPPNKNTGSGIFAGANGPLVTVMSEEVETKLLIAQVPIKSNPNSKISKGKVIDIESARDDKSSLEFFKANLTGFETKIISTQDENFLYNNEGFNCNIKVNYSELSDSKVTYRFAAFSGIKRYAIDRFVNIEYCGVIACSDDSFDSCGLRPVFKDPSVFHEIHISIKSSKQLSSFPVTVDKDILSISVSDYVFVYDTKDSMIQNMNLTSSHDDLISFGIFRL